MRLIRVALLLVIFLGAACGRSDQPAPLTVTYVANTGFLIECGGKKILIDALFGGFEADWYHVPPGGIVDLMTAARPPFDNVDIIAVTHAHTDHFNARMVTDHLVNNRRGILVCPAQAAQALETDPRYHDVKDRIRIMAARRDSTAELTVAGVEIKALGTPHEHSADSHRDVEHLEYLFTVGGRVIYHTGDGEMNDVRRYQAYGFGEKPIDLAFVCWWDAGDRLTFRQQLIHDIIRPERVILMHMLPNRPPIGNPERQQTVAKEVILPQLCLQSWGP
ncbi:MAG: MBL fold metallo-hydrolase [candidate division Zixibacteria bacterium]|nr:MBL fold metallo-hydrolase [candidate division Zixibacteria bacterium]